MKISRTHFYEIRELEQIINALTWTPLEYLQEPLRDWIEEEDRGEYLINILDDVDILALEQYTL